MIPAPGVYRSQGGRLPHRTETQKKKVVDVTIPGVYRVKGERLTTESLRWSRNIEDKGLSRALRKRLSRALRKMDCQEP